MGSGSRERIVEVFDALDAELDRLDEVSFEVLTTPERLRSLERLECLVRRLPAVGHALINQLDAQASEEELGGTLCCALANRLRITKPDAARRIADAADLGPRRALTGEPLAPQLTATATAQRQGLIGEAHIKVIRALFRPPARRGLDHPQKHPRPHRMATTTPPRPRPTPHQHLPPPRTIPPQPRRRRQTRLTPSSQSHTPQRRTTINTESVRAWPEQTRHGGRSCGHMPWSPPVVTTACAPTARVRVWRRPRLGRTADASSSHGERGS